MERDSIRRLAVVHSLGQAAHDQLALLRAKMVAPPVRPGWVARPRLFARLDAATKGALTLLSAPPGSGKTTLVSGWAARATSAVAWLSLDPHDDEPELFWAYVMASLQRLAPSRSGVRADRPLPAASLLDRLYEVVLSIGDDVVLVLDDYHVITAPAIHDTLALLLEHRPSTLHLVIASRADPPLPLARLRLHGELAELHAADLRLTAVEASQLLRAMGLEFPPALVEALLGRTEGWIAGVKLAGALVRQGVLRSEQVGSLRGDHRHLQAYFVEEVLQGQPAHVQAFLLATSLLARLSPPLCEALLASPSPAPGPDSRVSAGGERPPAAAVLEYLERAHLFVVALDSTGNWYRYHPLFGDVLRQRLRQRHPGWEQELHRRAGEWYEAEGLLLEAVPHALAAGDARRAVALLERWGATAFLRGELQPLRAWAEQLPEELRERSLELSLARAWSVAINGPPRAMERQVDELARQIEAQFGAEPRLDGQQEGRYRVNLTLIRAMAANRQGDPELALRHIQAAQTAGAARPRTGVLELQLGTAQMLRAELDLAAETYGRALRAAEAADSLLVALPTWGNLAMLERRRGRLSRAEAGAGEALRLAAQEEELPPVAGCALIALGVCSTARHELDAGLEQLTQGLALVRRWGSVLNEVHGLVELARVRLARGDSAGAAGAVRAAETLTEQFAVGWSKEAADLPALMVRVASASGTLDEVLPRVARLLRRDPEEGREPPAYVRRAHDLALGWAYLASGRYREAAALLDRLRQEFERAAWHGSVLEALALGALASWSLGEERTALDWLRRAVLLAGEAGQIQVFLDVGPALAPALQRLAQQPGAPAHLMKVLRVVQGAPGGRQVPDALSMSRRAPAPAEPVEPLRERELQILALIAAGRSTQVIADTLFIGVGTVRWHIKNLFSKLDAHSRTQAVARARELGILP